jgi:anhydro-N-acetylmuramic acid kinase
MDLAAVEFSQNNNKWGFSLLTAETIEYSNDWLIKLKNAPLLSGKKLMKLHAEYGQFIGGQINNFISKTGFKPHLVASHGHTVFHQPEKHFTFQMGSGAEISATTKIITIADFRSGDVALGGQGAPLVPVGDKYLFSAYDYCLNLGGFANISFEQNNKRIAFDICPVNIILNHLAQKHGLQFDKNGELGRKGEVNNELLQNLNNLPYYARDAPKSLGREWLENEFMKVIEYSPISDNDKLRTVYQHIAQQISSVIVSRGKMLITGGGAFNTFLLEQISMLTNTEIIIPSAEIVNYKEALVFAFLGVLRIKNINNCLATVTGASKDSCTGIVFDL